MKLVIKCFRQYADFSSRASRKEYWLFLAFHYITIIALVFITEWFGEDSLATLIFTIYYLSLIIPTLAVTCRRMHDTGRSGWWQLLTIIPIIGPLTVIYFTCLDSSPGSNKYGPNPKEV